MEAIGLRKNTGKAKVIGSGKNSGRVLEILQFDAQTVVDWYTNSLRMRRAHRLEFWIHLRKAKDDRVWWLRGIRESEQKQDDAQSWRVHKTHGEPLSNR